MLEDMIDEMIYYNLIADGQPIAYVGPECELYLLIQIPAYIHDYVQVDQTARH